jgi:hypothetical protein
MIEAVSDREAVERRIKTEERNREREAINKDGSTRDI